MTSVYEDDFTPEIDYRIRAYLRRYDDLFAALDDPLFDASLTEAGDLDAWETHGPLFGTRSSPLVDVKAASYELTADAPASLTRRNPDRIVIRYAVFPGTEAYGGDYIDMEYGVAVSASCGSVRRLTRVRKALDADRLLERLTDDAHSGERFHQSGVFDVETLNTIIDKDEESGHFTAEIDLSIRQSNQE